VRCRPFIVTAIFTGMRSSEVRGLTWSAMDFTNKTITVRQRADEWGSMGQPKSHAGQRVIPMSPSVINTLKEWKLVCPKGPLNLAFRTRWGR
jgi:integrase